MTGFIYFLQVAEAGPIKIGYTNFVERRMVNIQLGCPDELRLLGVIEGAMEFEGRLHKTFRSCLVRGEWFSPHKRLLRFIANRARPLESQTVKLSDGQHPLKIWRHGQKPKVTLAALARRVGCTPSHLSEIENYKNEPSLDLTDRLSEASGLEMKAFVLPSQMRQSETVL